MKTPFILLLVVTLFFFASCSDNDPAIPTDSIAYFDQHLKADMQYEHLKTTFGEPDNDIGSGIHIYVYNLNDNTKVYIGFADKIIYARHMDFNNNLIRELI